MHNHYELDVVLLPRNRKISQKQSKPSRGYNRNNELVSYSSNYKNQSFIMKTKRNNNSNA